LSQIVREERLMWLGPFFKRELMTSSWRTEMFRHRVITVASLVVALAAFVVGWPLSGRERSTVGGMAHFGLVAFVLLVAVLASLTMGLVITEIAPAIAAKRDKKTLDLLLTTRLTNAEIILGILGARLARCAAWLAATAPVVLLAVILGGVDPLLAALAGACLVSWALSLAALSIAASVFAPTAVRAFSLAAGLTMAWVCGPMCAYLVLPRIWPAGSRVVMPLLVWLIESSPIVAMVNLTGMFSRAPFLDTMLWMMALQSAGAIVLVLCAIWQLRPASRGLADGEARSRVVRALRARWMRRPACGDDPILWYEMHSARGTSRMERAGSRVCRVIGIGLFAALVFSFAAPAFRELAERGYSASADNLAVPEFHPLARALVTKLSNLGNTLAPGAARLEFNVILRQSSAAICYLCLFMLAVAASESIATERERDTWLGVIATPLSGTEILRAKILGAVWRIRDCIGVLIALWIVGLLAGALHPLGFIAAVLSLGTSIAFFAAWGVYVSLWASTRASAANQTFPIALLIPFCAFFIFLPIQPALRCPLSAGSVPLLTWSALLSYEDVSAMFHSGVFPQFAPFRLPSPPSAAQVVVTWFLGTAAYAATAFFFARAAFRGFDAAVDRPRRSPLRTLDQDIPVPIVQPGIS
jgi:hypothetical protein